jgi:hypothetical protein
MGKSVELEELPHEFRFVPLSLESVTHVCETLDRIQLILQKVPLEDTLRMMEPFYHRLQKSYGILGSYDRRTATVSGDNIIHVIRARCERALQVFDQLQTELFELTSSLKTYHDDNSPHPQNPPEYRMDGSRI